VVWPLAVIEKALYPLIRVTQKFSQLFTRNQPSQVVTKEEILATIHDGGRTGELTAAELRMLDAVMHFDKLLCQQMMVPRGEVAFVGVAWTLSQCLEQARRTQRTRYPARRESLDEVLGILHIKDLMGIEPGGTVNLSSFLRPPQHVPETKPINELLAEMQRARQHMAIVVDERGSTAGIITLENIIEEIEGAVQDEFDMESPDLVRLGKGNYLVRGGMPLEKLNRALHLDLRAANVNTVSGYLVARVGRFVEVGDRVEGPGIEAEVLEVEGKRASRIRLRVVSKPPQGGQSVDN
jgi:CBS domain containing-hemolysin-like protein